MDRNTRETYKRGALFVVPVMLIVGCRVGARACIALSKGDDRRAQSEAIDKKAEADKELAIAAANAAADREQRRRARSIPKAESGWAATTIATAQQVPDALAANADVVAWLSTRSGEVVVAPRAGGKPRVVATGRKLPLRRHVQGLALANGWVYWVAGDGIERAKLDGGEPEVVLSNSEGVTAIAVEKDTVWFTRTLDPTRDEDDEPTGGLYQLTAGKKAAKAVRVLAAEQPCGIALDDKAAYVIETLQIRRAPKTGKAEPKTLVKGSQRLGCSVAVDEKDVYWTMPSEDSLLHAKKIDGSGTVAVSVRKRPWNVVVDRGYAYVLAETSPQALGELGSVFRVAVRADPGSEAALPAAIVTDRVGLSSIAASGGTAFVARFDEAETDGTIEAVSEKN